MLTDLTTQEIWHFIGAFHQVIEDARQRLEYEAYQAHKAQVAKGELSLLSQEFKAPYTAGDFKPNMRFDLAADNEKVSAFTEIPLPQHPTEIARDPQSFNPAITALPGLDAIGAPELPAGWSFVLPIPGSAALVVVQMNYMSDLDIFIQQDLGVDFLPFTVFERPLQDLLDVANRLTVIGDYDPPADMAAISALGWQIHDDVQAIEAPLVEGATIHLFMGGDTDGIHVNGELIDEAPKFSDALPVLPEVLNVPLGGDWVEALTEAGTREPVHVLVTGGNTLVNEVIVNVAWVDAPVILVQGNALSVQAISQINVLHETSQVNGLTGAVHIGMTETQMLNIAMNMTEASPHPEVTVQGEGTFPSSWVVTTVDADLMLLNWVQQKNFVLDHDIVSASFSGHSSYFLLGDNTAVNVSALLDFSFGYDLIVIGGDMINVSMIRQMNVLYDADWVASGNSAGMDILTGGNLLWNAASISGHGLDGMMGMDAAYAGLALAVAEGSTGPVTMPMNDPSFEGIGTLNVLYITGNAFSVQMIDQTNILGDSDQVAVLAADTVLLDGASVTVVTGANALGNLATINPMGVDSTIHVAGDHYSDAMLYQANFIENDGADVYQDMGPGALTNEAVLFLADGMLGEDDAAPLHVYDADSMGSNLDGVNAVLA